MQQVLDNMFKETGHSNAYFPLFIPLSYLEREAEHIEGFAKECAVVTHHRLEPGPEGGLVPTGELDEPYVVRPTSETIIGEMYSKWVQSYRDLPILINQWANVVRWELRPRLFLRTAEFLWQEGHTAHASADEAIEETLRMLDLYSQFAEQYMAMPVIRGEKTAGERFPGAVNTYAIEAMMQDRKALQAGTSHFLGQNFARACDISFSDRDGTIAHAWTTSWGVSTRLVGGLIMTHGDDDGVVLPPRLAPQQVVILPIYKNSEQRSSVLNACETLEQTLKKSNYADEPLRVTIDDRDLRGGEKNWHHVKHGVPIRVEIGPRDLEAGVVSVARRDEPPRERQSLPLTRFTAEAPTMLSQIQCKLFERACKFREANTQRIEDLRTFEEYFQEEDHSGFAIAPMAEKSEDDPAFQELLKRLKITPRCILGTTRPSDNGIPNGVGVASSAHGVCVFTGAKNAADVVFARAY
jgi:prolyl-tRNA synthetase